LVAALKFFLGQDEAAEAAAEAGDDSDDDDDVDKPKTGVGTAAGTSSGVSKEDVYKAYNKARLIRYLPLHYPFPFRPVSSVS
jgi:protein SDA1